VPRKKRHEICEAIFGMEKTGAFYAEGLCIIRPRSHCIVSAANPEVMSGVKYLPLTKEMCVMPLIPRPCVSSVLRSRLIYLIPALLLSIPAFGGNVTVTGPAANSTNPSATRITAFASENESFHLELWDNGTKLGNVMASSVNAVYTLASGSHTLTVEAVSGGGALLDKSSVSYQVKNAASGSNIDITSPTANSTSISAVTIAASASESQPFSLQVWDNGYELGEISASSVNGVYVLPSGSHDMTVQAVASDGTVLDQSSVSFQVAENCTNSSTVECNVEQDPIDNTQSNCDPAPAAEWVANFCGSGIQGADGRDPEGTDISSVTEGGTIADQGNLTLNGQAIHLSETRGSNPANALFRAQSPNSSSASTVDSNWTMDEYVYLPNPAAHQAFEMDAQYSINGIWTKFYTECAFNMDAGTGYWEVFDSETGGWIALNGKSQNGQTPPRVPCNRSQFAQPWSGSSNPSFTGWHHVVWNFIRNGDGTVTFKSLTFDATTTQINFSPNSKTGGSVNDNGNFSALIQLDGVNNPDGQYDTVDAYINELNVTHTP
jgi:hypothetical protein